MAGTERPVGYTTKEHECCPCVERLRAQNKASSDDWTKRTAKMASDLDGLRHLMAEALAFHRGTPISHGISQYGQAALAEALRIADEAEVAITALRTQLGAERSARRAAEDRLRNAQAHNWQRENRINELELDLARAEKS
jgi:flagellin-like hook-associated protein FlgL